MAWTSSNPVTIGNPTKKGDYDKLWDNVSFFQFDHNIGLAASVGSNALTVALKGQDGNNPSATNPVMIAFRSSTITTGTPVIRTVAGALSVVLSSGSTLGFTSGEAGRIYIWAIDNAGTVELALSRVARAGADSQLVTTTAEGGAGAADSATEIYSTTARSNVPCRCIGYLEITTGATAGQWGTAPSKIQIMLPGIRRTGEIVQVESNVVSSLVIISTSIPADDTPPLYSEGTEILSKAIVPTSAVNKIIVTAVANLSGYHDDQEIIALFKNGSGTDPCVAAARSYWVIPNGYNGGQLILQYECTAGGTSAITFSVRAGRAGSYAIDLNGTGGGTRLFGGTNYSFLEIKEVVS